MKKKAENKPGVPEPISCRYVDSASTRCKQCNERNASCQRPPALLMGNARDLTEMTAFMVDVAETGDEEADPVTPPDGGAPMVPCAYSLPFRQALAGACMDLRLAFSQLEISHCSEYGLSGNKKNTAETAQAYRSLVQERLMLLAARWPRPLSRLVPSTANSTERREIEAVNRKDLQAWENAQLPRLLITDAGWTAWLVAIRGARDTFRKAMAEEPGIGKKEALDLMADFPCKVPTS
ncbi:hypothetical protein PT974_11370 [Cladobotryum mycophilum]|uniref:Uncharacterized protein n=1 Tax=Cladobotryum mycophilum TaxID=491253 RepID=A0ABR0S6D3_9HYPO